jgi:thiamine biosynthesis lipoprotein ApbE
VVGDDATTADALSTALLVGGLSLARAWVQEHPETLVLLVLEDDPGRLRCLGARERLDVESGPGIRIVGDEE